MSEIRLRDRILEAIDQLRRRKARPDVARICSFMFRRFSVSAVETKSDLQKLIDAEIVYKVVYKGNTSYRNAAKWAMLPAYKKNLHLQDTTTLLSSAVAELILLEPDYLDIGVPGYELEKLMLNKDKRFSKNKLESIIKREIEIGTLVRLENGHYFLGPHPATDALITTGPGRNGTTQESPGVEQSQTADVHLALTKSQPISKVVNNSPPPIYNTPQRPKKPKPIMKSTQSPDKNRTKEDIKFTTEGDRAVVIPAGIRRADSFDEELSRSNGVRVGGRQKRAKVVFDPSDTVLPKVKKRGPGRPLGSQNVTKAVSPIPPVAATGTQTAAKPLPNGTVPVVQHKPVGALLPPGPVSTKSAVGAAEIAKSLLEPAPSLPGVCAVCHSYGVRVKGVPERLISCTDCTSRAHPSCLENERDKVPGRVRDGTWTCIHCKTCSVCEETAEVGGLVICVDCQDAYHFRCHTPTVPERLRAGRWHCHRCAPPTEEKPPTDGGSPGCPATVPSLHRSSAESQVKQEHPAKLNGQHEHRALLVPEKCLQDPFEAYPIDERIPDASNWSADEVYRYFEERLQPETARVFKEQEIDGMSLLMMRRVDVLAGLSLKLGPALKVYKHVRMLQTRRSHTAVFYS